MTWWDVGTALLFGSVCLGCDRPGRPWCPRCLDALQQRVDPHVVGQEPPTVACVGYEGCVPEALVGYKDRNVRSLAPVLADIIAAGVQHLDTEAVLTPAPSSPAAVRRRGFDHTALLARLAAARLGLPAKRLLRSRGRRDQAGLSTTQRRRNLEGSMWVPHAGDEAVIVIDDVRTTGATLGECGRALRAAGYPVFGNVVIASAHG